MARQAVLLIHGIGNQRPMQTLRAFVRAVWTDDKSLQRDHAQGAALWSKPYTLSRDFELRRLTTAQNTAGMRTDFFEMYWAHLMSQTKLSHVWGWLKSLLLRRYASVPPALRTAYVALWILAVACVLLVVAAAAGKAAGHPSLPAWASAILGVLVVPALTMVLTDIVGDAARYLHVHPDNIQRRHEIRSAGVQVIESLHAQGYERIVVVGHSLGSVIGYDILTHAWAEMSGNEPYAGDAQLHGLEAMAAAGTQGADAVQAAQRRLFEQRRAAGARWRVSDFVTLGSPLAHAAILLARDLQDLQAKVDERELPSCLPALESTTFDRQPWSGFSYPPGPAARRLHHAAVFAATRWTNLYFPSRALIVGDLIGGPLCGVLGNGIRDVAVNTRRWLGLLSHTFYWVPDGRDSHIAALREAIDLGDARRDAAA